MGREESSHGLGHWCCGCEWGGVLAVLTVLLLLLLALALVLAVVLLLFCW